MSWKTVFSIATSFLVGYLFMVAFKYLHHDVSSVPALGYWACLFPVFALQALIRSTRETRGNAP